MDEQITILSNDFEETLQAAQFQIILDKNFNRNQLAQGFFQDFPVKKNRFWKTGNNFRYFLGKKLEKSENCVVFGCRFKGNCLEKVREEVRKIFWVSYREKFRSLDLKLITSDIGWGCTVRVGQMMILETFRRILQESDLELVMMIQDNLESAPFALREVMRVGKSFGKKPGDWFSPANISYVFTVLLEEHPVKNLKPLLSLNSALYEDQVFALAFGIDRKTARKICKCEENEYEDLGVTCARCGKELTEFHWKFDLFIQIPVMLGLGSVLPEYLMTVKHLLSCPLTVGVIGGKPRMALYLIGFTQDSFLVLDPHFVQKSCKSKEKVEKTLSSYHVDSPKLLKDHDLEGSMSFGFLVNSKQDWNTLKDYLNQPETKGVIVVRENEEVNTLDSSTFERSSFLLV